MVHVRTDGEEAAVAREPKDLLDDGGTVKVTTATAISTTADGPFLPVVDAFENNPAVQEAFARVVPTPSLAAWSKLRLAILVAAAAPLLMLLELDRELVAKNLLGTGRFLVDVILVAFVAFELTRKTPRLPGVAGLAMLAVAMRWSLVATRLCGKDVHVAVWACAGLAVVTGLLLLARAPSRARVALELLAKLGLGRDQILSAAADEPPPSKLLYGALAAAAGLPLLMAVIRRAELPLAVRAGAFVLYGAIVPFVVRRFTDDAAQEAGNTSASLAKIDPKRVLFAIAAGLAATSALVHGSHQFFEAGGELARCTSRLDIESQRALAAEAAELAKRIASVRGSFALAIMTTAVMPLAEERIYRGLLMNVLVRKYGTTYGMVAAAAAFGIAHVGVYEIALYQTVLLGVAFGIAYAEGGIIAAFVVHALWNLLNVA